MPTDTEQRELHAHNKASVHQRFAEWAKSHGWAKDKVAEDVTELSIVNPLTDPDMMK